MKKLILLFPLLLFASVKEEIVKFYKSHYPTIKIINIYSNKPFPKHYKKIDFKLANYKMPSSTIIIDGKYYFYKIKAKIKVYLATKVIKINEAIIGNATFKFIDFRNFYSKPIYKLSPDLAASKIISKNAVINESNTKIKPLIVSGDSINVIFQNSTIDVYAKGKALNDANIGDSVKVKIKGKIYEGKVDKNANVIIR
jgi:flagella basal body P-ring formation protein FlgA